MDDGAAEREAKVEEGDSASNDQDDEEEEEDADARRPASLPPFAARRARAAAAGVSLLEEGPVRRVSGPKGRRRDGDDGAGRVRVEAEEAARAQPQGRAGVAP